CAAGGPARRANAVSDSSQFSSVTKRDALCIVHAHFRANTQHHHSMPRYELKNKVGITGLGAGVWNIGPGGDPFGGPTRDPIPMLARWPMLAGAGRRFSGA